jgi:thioredoxin 1
MSTPYDTAQPERATIDATPGVVVLDFGTNWCGYCQAAEPLITQAVGDYPAATHIKVEDGPGRPLGRSFKVKLWPTVVVLKDGQEIARVVRPTSADAVRAALTQAGA